MPSTPIAPRSFRAAAVLATLVLPARAASAASVEEVLADPTALLAQFEAPNAIAYVAPDPDVPVAAPSYGAVAWRASAATEAAPGRYEVPESDVAGYVYVWNEQAGMVPLTGVAGPLQVVVVDRDAGVDEIRLFVGGTDGADWSLVLTGPADALQGNALPGPQALTAFTTASFGLFVPDIIAVEDSAALATGASILDAIALDTDGDGLTDYDEALVLTDALRTDTDGDGRGDAEEVSVGTNPQVVDAPAKPATEDSAQTGTDPTSPDADSDGLTDAEELALGTDPHDPDTDGDGLTDRRELELGTLPTLADTDGDALLDGYEIAIGTDPNSADTDGDLVPDALDPHPTVYSTNDVPQGASARDALLLHLTQFRDHVASMDEASFTRYGKAWFLARAEDALGSAFASPAGSASYLRDVRERIDGVGADAMAASDPSRLDLLTRVDSLLAEIALL